MTENRRMTSTARRINRSFTFRLIITLLFVDAFVFALAVGGWCYNAERTVLGTTWTIHLQRGFYIDSTLPLYDRLSSLSYSFALKDAEAVRIPGGAFFPFIWYLGTALLSMEALLLLGQYGAGKRRAQALLKPLYRMAETAQALDRHFDERKYHDLETAISRVNPEVPNARLYTGDRDLKELEDAINSLLLRTHEAYRQQVRFVSDASHELRTPISVIKGYAEMLNRWGKDDPKVLSEAIGAIQAESENMQRLVEQLLFLARGDTGRIQMEHEALDLSVLIGEVYEESLMIYQDHEMTLSAPVPVPAVGDASTLKQVARILTENAARYSPKGDRITLRTFVNDRNESCFSVQDNGIGIRDEDIPHIFERFFRSDPARVHRNGGTGLGLSIAKWIVDNHNGYFDVVSRESVGTRITVCLPQNKPQPSPDTK